MGRDPDEPPPNPLCTLCTSASRVRVQTVEYIYICIQVEISNEGTTPTRIKLQNRIYGFLCP